MKYKSINHLSERATEMIRFRLNDDLCDVTIIAGERKIHAHKLVLAASSPYFRSMFTGSLSVVNRPQPDVTIRGVDFRGVDEEALEALISFCYTSSIELGENNVESLLSAACYLHVIEIKVSSNELLFG